MTDRGYGRISLDTARSGSISKQYGRISGASGPDMEWYADESVSGAKIPLWMRPEGKRLMDDLQPGDRVLVTKIDRAARSVRDLLDLVEMIAKRGASIVFVDQNIDTSGPMGRFILTLLGAIAELEAAIIAERRRESLESFAREGRHAVGKAPWGFLSVENPNGRGLVIRPDPELATQARELVERIMAGEPQSSVRESIGMSKTGMHKWLHNPRLAGMTPDGDGVVTIDGIPRVDPEAAILSVSEWRSLQEYLKKPDKAWNKREGYGAALRCGVCGSRMYLNASKVVNAQTGATHDTYTCRRDKHAPGQSAPSVMVHRADAYLEEKFLDLFGSRRAVRGEWSDSLLARDEAVSMAEVRLTEAQRRFEATVSEEEEDEALAYLRSAKQALRAAQAIRGGREFRIEDSGQTVEEVWNAADTAERCRLLTQAGRWVLHSGRASIDKRIVFESDDMLSELLTHEPGGWEDESVDHRDVGTFMLSPDMV